MEAPRPDELIAIAHLTRPHGVRGELNAIALTPPVVDMGQLVAGRLYARDPAGRLLVFTGQWARPHLDRWLIKLETIDDMDAANELRGLDLCLPREELPELPEGWYWESDIERCRVVDRTLGEIGQAAGLDVHGAQTWLKVRRPAGHTALIPWAKAMIERVDLTESVIYVNLPAEFPGVSDSTVNPPSES